MSSGTAMPEAGAGIGFAVLFACSNSFVAETVFSTFEAACALPITTFKGSAEPDRSYRAPDSPCVGR
jgi:hypothetical protein